MRFRWVFSVLASLAILFAVNLGAQTDARTAPQPTPEQLARMPVKALPVRDFKLLSSNTGWASTGHRLLLTTDGGTSWKDISPPNPRGDGYADVFFLNADTGWVLLSHQMQDGENTGNNSWEEDWAFYVASTTDGGSTWTETHVQMPSSATQTPSLSDGGSFTFADRLHGWLSLVNQSGSAFSFCSLLITSDGGRTWREAKGNPGFCGTIRAYPNGEIWVTGDSNPNEEGDRKELIVSHDGANSFQRVFLPDPAVVVGYEPTYGLPVLTDSLNGYEEVAYKGGKGDKSAAVLFATTDGGRTWHVDRILSNLAEISVGLKVDSAVVDSIWILPFAPNGSQPTLMKLHPKSGTADGANARLNYYNCGPSFVTQDEGWVNCSGSLSSTINGGATWTIIAPRARNGVLTTDPLTPLPPSKPLKTFKIKTSAVGASGAAAAAMAAAEGISQSGID